MSRMDVKGSLERFATEYDHVRQYHEGGIDRILSYEVVRYSQPLLTVSLFNR